MCKGKCGGVSLKPVSWVTCNPPQASVVCRNQNETRPQSSGMFTTFNLLEGKARKSWKPFAIRLLLWAGHPFPLQSVPPDQSSFLVGLTCPWHGASELSPFAIRGVAEAEALPARAARRANGKVCGELWPDVLPCLGASKAKSIDGLVVCKMRH